MLFYWRCHYCSFSNCFDKKVLKLCNWLNTLWHRVLIKSLEFCQWIYWWYSVREALWRSFIFKQCLNGSNKEVFCHFMLKVSVNMSWISSLERFGWLVLPPHLTIIFHFTLLHGFRCTDKLCKNLSDCIFS